MDGLRATIETVAALWNFVWGLISVNRETLVALAALASAVGAWTATRVSVRNARIQIGEARVNALRDDFSELFATAIQLSNLRPGTFAVGDDEIKFRQERLSRARLLNFRVRFRLDDLQTDLSRRLIEIMTALYGDSSIFKDMEFDELLSRAESISRDVLKAEWKRVKAGRLE